MVCFYKSEWDWSVLQELRSTKKHMHGALNAVENKYSINHIESSDTCIEHLNAVEKNN